MARLNLAMSKENKKEGETISGTKGYGTFMFLLYAQLTQANSGLITLFASC